jgi:hypothetical protein
VFVIFGLYSAFGEKLMGQATKRGVIAGIVGGIVNGYILDERAGIATCIILIIVGVLKDLYDTPFSVDRHPEKPSVNAPAKNTPDSSEFKRPDMSLNAPDEIATNSSDLKKPDMSLEDLFEAMRRKENSSLTRLTTYIAKVKNKVLQTLNEWRKR